ncbi:hypothetical protein ACPPVO_34805 [Dactylosporangium sp. McL0621]|uniref:hypothetical protein n=1 Tax=Dactylosporangium sp. McL0621 TaxID=3415678 RepID=UPI003CF6ED6A
MSMSNRHMLCCTADMKRRTGLTLSVAILLAGTAGVAGWRWRHNRPPYGPDALSAQATLQLVDQAIADAALKPVNAIVAGDGDQMFLGRVTWTRPPNPQNHSSFRIVLLDKRSHLMPSFLAVTSAQPDRVTAGSDESLDIAQQRYPWLQGIGTRKINGSFTSTGTAVCVWSADASPVTFQTVLHPAHPGTLPEQTMPTAPTATEDLLIALISVGPDGQVYWAQRLLH